MIQQLKSNSLLRVGGALTLLIALLAAGGPASAQTSGAPASHALAPAPKPLTLAEAVGLARKHSLSAAGNREHLASTLATREVTAAAGLPSLSYSAAATYNVLPAGSAGVGNGLSGFPAPGSYVDSSVSASQSIFDAFATRDALAVSDYTAEITRLTIDQSEQDDMRDAALDFLLVLRNQGLAGVAADAMSQAQEHLKLGQSKTHAGTGTRGDVLQLEAQLANAEAAFTQAQNAVTLSVLTLANVVNAPIDDRPLAPNPPVPVVVARAGMDLATGLARRQEVREAELKLLSDRSRVDTAGRSQWPTLSGRSSYSQRDLAEGNFNASLNMSVPIYSGDKPRHQMEAAIHDAAADQDALDQERQTVKLEIRTNYQSQQEAISRVATTRRGLTAAQEAYHIALSRYRAGLSNLFELVDVQTTLIQAQGNYVQAAVDQSTASIKLARSLGEDMGSFLGVHP